MQVHGEMTSCEIAEATGLHARGIRNILTSVDTVGMRRVPHEWHYDEMSGKKNIKIKRCVCLFFLIDGVKDED